MKNGGFFLSMPNSWILVVHLQNLSPRESVQWDPFLKSIDVKFSKVEKNMVGSGPWSLEVIQCWRYLHNPLITGSFNQHYLSSGWSTNEVQQVRHCHESWWCLHGALWQAIALSYRIYASGLMLRGCRLKTTVGSGIKPPCFLSKLPVVLGGAPFSATNFRWSHKFNHPRNFCQPNFQPFSLQFHPFSDDHTISAERVEQ